MISKCTVCLFKDIRTSSKRNTYALLFNKLPIIYHRTNKGGSLDWGRREDWRVEGTSCQIYDFKKYSLFLERHSNIIETKYLQSIIQQIADNISQGQYRKKFGLGKKRGQYNGVKVFNRLLIIYHKTNKGRSLVWGRNENWRRRNKLLDI